MRPAGIVLRSDGTSVRRNIQTAASPKGPWKSGDTLASDAAPQLAGHGFEINPRIDSTSPKGVILAQGGAANSYALFVQNGKLALALRAQRALTVITAEKPFEPGARKISAQLAAEGKGTLTVDGEKVGEGKATLIPKQPGQALDIGSDGAGAVGEYEAPNDFGGKVENATVSVL